MVRDVEAVLDYLRAEHRITDVTMLGFSAGGHIAYLAACRLPLRKSAVLYGGWITSDDIPLSRPEPTIELTPGIRGTLLYLVGEDDHVIDARQLSEIERALAAGPARGEVIRYPGVRHAFFWPGTDAFDAAARDDAWRRILQLVREPAGRD